MSLVQRRTVRVGVFLLTVAAILIFIKITLQAIEQMGLVNTVHPRYFLGGFILFVLIITAASIQMFIIPEVLNYWGHAARLRRAETALAEAVATHIDESEAILDDLWLETEE